MPVVPSFGNYAAMPDFAGAYLGGQRIALGREQLAQEAQQASARFAMEGQRLQEQRQIAEMELSAKMATQQQEQMRRQQEMEIEKSYRQTQIGLEERRLQQASQLMDMKLKEAAQSFAAQQTYQTEMAAPGADPLKVLMRLGPSVGASIPAAAFKSQEEAVPFGKEYPVAGGGRVVQTSERGGQFVKAELPKGAAGETEVVRTPDGSRVIGYKIALPNGRQQFVAEKADPRVKEWKTETTKLEEEARTIKGRYSSDNQERFNPESKAYKKLGTEAKKEADSYLAKRARIDEIQGLIRGLERGSASSPAVAPAGTSTNSVPRILSIRRK